MYPLTFLQSEVKSHSPELVPHNIIERTCVEPNEVTAYLVVDGKEIDSVNIDDIPFALMAALCF